MILSLFSPKPLAGSMAAFVWRAIVPEDGSSRGQWLQGYDEDGCVSFLSGSHVVRARSPRLYPRILGADVTALVKNFGRIRPRFPTDVLTRVARRF